MKKELRNKFYTAKEVSLLLVNIVVILGAFIAYFQWQDYQAIRSADISLKFSEYLDEEPYLGILKYLDTDDATKRVFSPNGRYSVYDIDRYLGTFEMLGELYDKHQISCQTLYFNFSYYIEKAYANNEIRAYVNEPQARKEGWWANFIALTRLAEGGCPE